jgi:hypothetical protein
MGTFKNIAEPACKFTFNLPAIRFQPMLTLLQQLLSLSQLVHLPINAEAQQLEERSRMRKVAFFHHSQHPVQQIPTTC